MKNKVLPILLLFALAAPLVISNYLKLVDAKSEVVFCENTSEEDRESKEESLSIDCFDLTQMPSLFTFKTGTASLKYFSKSKALVDFHLDVSTPPPKNFM